jgi:hypothetical protein
VKDVKTVLKETGQVLEGQVRLLLTVDLTWWSMFMESPVDDSEFSD